MSPFTLENRVALVTGSSTGLGKETAACLGRAGAKIAINYANNKKRASPLLLNFMKWVSLPNSFRQTLRAPEDIDSMATAIEQSLGPIDIAVLNATPAQPLKPIEEYDWDFHQQMLDFFVKSPYLLARRLLPGMKERKYGRLINITSEVFLLGVAPFSAYAAAKGGQTGWSRSMANELAPHGITVNMVAPGWVPTERHKDDPQEDKDGYIQTVPMGRWGKPDDVGWAVTYFASDEASFVTGQTIAVNGGKTVW